MEYDYDVDVLVAGGGPAGITAAIAAARNQVKTLLVEKHGFLGGMITAGLVTWPGGFHTEQGEQVIKGIPQELVDKTVQMGSMGHQLSPVRPNKITVTVFDEEILKYVAEEMVQQAGAEILLHSFIFNVDTGGDRIQAVHIANKSSKQTIRAKVVVDATGDGDVVAWSGAPFEQGREEDGLCMPVTTVFKMDRVNTKELVSYMEDNPEKFRKGKGWFRDIWVNRSSILFCNFAAFSEEWDRAVEKGELPAVIDKEHSGAGIRLGTSREDELYMNMTRVIGIDSTDVKSLTKGEIEGRRQVMLCSAWLKKNVPGFRQARLVCTAPQVAIRESRRFNGQYVLAAKDIVEGRKFEDVVAKNAMGLDIHEQTEQGGHKWVRIRNGGSYGIPYRSLLPLKIENLIVAGRCISCTQQAFTSVRWGGPCMATGQAAGTAAALAVRESKLPKELDIKYLQNVLLEQGACL